jgi:hypothetical protein
MTLLTLKSGVETLATIYLVQQNTLETVSVVLPEANLK